VLVDPETGLPSSGKNAVREIVREMPDITAEQVRSAGRPQRPEWTRGPRPQARVEPGPGDYIESPEPLSIIPLRP